MDQGKDYFWQCSHCSWYPLSCRLDLFCINTSCARRRDYSATIYNESRRFDHVPSAVPEGDEIRNLVNKHRISPLPPELHPLSRVLMSIPSDCLRFSEQEDMSLSNKCKGFLEQLAGEPWCWWPFRPRMRLLEYDETRMHWRCVGGFIGTFYYSIN